VAGLDLEAMGYIGPLDVDEGWMDGWMDGLVILEMKKNNPQLSTIIINGLPGYRPFE
jgi:hypothetical protein